MGTLYLTPQQLESIVGCAHLAAAAPGDTATCTRDSTITYDADTVAAAIGAASDMVDARLRTRYDIPLEDVPDFLRRAVARLVHHELVDEAAVTDLIESRAAEARKIVDGLASGKLQIGADTDGDGEANERTRHGRAVVHIPEGRTFRRRDTGGIV